ncbi:glycosyltransferase family A protein [Lentilactobacillus sp. Marseille-Q4993]|uniref:glycosyltransferase family A protein n=1 Tax=Lentilactobacillus sp. Marseille-Q4993 TaxID=3039492 RepID=UPI0024BC406D|nr:glycosyltransferase family A protein [Lentilactobacillus sp. Marseille-Q4993]
MVNDILITVGVPTHNLDKYLPEMLDSLANQKYQNFEVIVVDDASTDDTADVIRKYAKLDSRFRGVFLNTHVGVSGARNRAIDEAKGDVITFVDGDDVVDQNFLEVMAVGMADPEINMVTVGYTWGYRGAGLTGKKLVEVSKRKTYDAINTRGNGMGGYVWNKAFRTKILRDKNIRFDESLALAEDLLFTADYVAATEHFLFYPQPLYDKVSRPGSTIHSAGFKLREKEYEVREHIDEMGRRF